MCERPAPAPLQVTRLGTHLSSRYSLFERGGSSCAKRSGRAGPFNRDFSMRAHLAPGLVAIGLMTCACSIWAFYCPAGSG
jgi:hypothetical protein